jgi:O-antigen/teichoic acid export membrane protein
MSDMNENKKTASLKKRYLFKLINNLVGLIVGVATQSIVPRALGPASYGNFSFLTNFFWQTVGFLNLNSSTAFYTKLSQRQNEKGLISFYGFFIIGLGLVLCLFVTICFASGFSEYIWPGQITIFVIMAALWAFLRLNNDALILVADAFGLTVKSESINVTIKLFGLLIIFFLFWMNWVTLTNYFIYFLFILIVTICCLVWVIQSSGFVILGNWRINKKQAKGYTQEFIQFCLPLVVFIAFSTAATILDRWLLQKFSGSVQQGFYGLAYQIGTICFLFVSAMIPLVMREYAISFNNEDIKELRR